MKNKDMMGQRVAVNKRYMRVGWPTKRYILQDGRSREGWIVGFRTIQNGKMVNDYDGPFVDGGAHWEASEYIPCVLVAFHPYQNPIKVPLDGFDLLPRT